MMNILYIQQQKNSLPLLLTCLSLKKVETNKKMMNLVICTVSSLALHGAKRVRRHPCFTAISTAKNCSCFLVLCQQNVSGLCQRFVSKNFPAEKSEVEIRWKRENGEGKELL